MGVELNVITGGPGAGKTTLLNELGRYGYTTVDEAARLVIEEEQKKQKNGTEYVLPQNNITSFQRLVYHKQLELESQAKGTTYLDRGIIDNVGYSNAFKIPVSIELHKLSTNAKYERVFILEPIPRELYKNDNARTETYEESVRISDHLEKAYRSYGYNVERVPFMEKEQRAQYIIERSKQQKAA